MVALRTLDACSSDDKDGTEPAKGSIDASSQDAASQGVLFRAPAGTDGPSLNAAADIVRGRLARMGVTDAVVAATDEGVAVQSSADGYQLHAAAQRHATTIAPVITSAVGPCTGPGTPSAGGEARCYVLGDPLTGVTAITDTAVQSSPGAGWKLTFSIDSARYKSFRADLEQAADNHLALVSDDVVALVFGSGVPALQSEIGPPLGEDQARHAAAAMAVDSDLPVNLEAPPLPTPSGARVDVDFWTAALGVNICGTWLPNAPASGLDTGVHTHGDGLIYIQPVSADEAGDQATLGLMLQRGGWAASSDRLLLWDGTEHRSGTACPNGQPAQVRWWLDSVEQHGDPAQLVPRNGQVVVLSFDSDPSPPGDPPQVTALYVPALRAAT